RATDETHRGHAEAPPIQPKLRAIDEPRIIGQAEIVVGAEIERFLAVDEPNARRLRRADHSLALVEPMSADVAEHVAHMGKIRVVHDGILALASSIPSSTAANRLPGSAARADAPLAARSSAVP